MSIQPKENCPFCGKEAGVYEIPQLEGEVCYGVGCLTPNCYGQQIGYMVGYFSPEEAVKAWDTRANPDAIKTETSNSIKSTKTEINFLLKKIKLLVEGLSN